MKPLLRFLCFASLLALIICLAGGGHIGLADEADSIGMATHRQEESCKPPTPVDRAGNVTTENRHSSGTIMITMTGIVGDPGDLGAE